MAAPESSPSPPRLALALLLHGLPPGEYEAIAGDLTEVFADRVQSRRLGNSLWFWAQTLSFLCGFAASPDALPAPRGSVRMFMSQIASSVRAALRLLRLDPGYATAFVITLGLAIGATTAIFSAVEGVLIRPLPYPHADRIVYLQQPAVRMNIENQAFSFVEVADYRKQVSSFQELVEYGDWQFNVVGLGEPRLTYGGLVTSNYFTVLAIRAELGRTLLPEDDQKASAPVVVLTHEFWVRAVGADPNIVGQSIELSGVVTKVVGVLESGSHYAGTHRAEMYANYPTNNHYMSATMQGARAHRMTDLYALIKPGIPLDSARAEATHVMETLHTAYPADYPNTQGFGLTLTPWREMLVRKARPTLLVLMGAVGLVLLVACANVGNLTLARLVRRERELAVRSALGATAVQLRTQLVVEHLMLALVGSGLGVGIAALAHNALADYTSRMTLRADALGLNGTVLGFSIAVAAVAALVFAWAPRLPSAGTSASSAGTRTTAGRAERRAQRLLVGAQIAVSFIILVGAGLLVRTFMNLQNVDPGFNPEHVVVVRTPNVSINAATMKEYNAKTHAIFDPLVSRIQALPGVLTVATTSRTPFQPVTVPAQYVRTEGGMLDQPQSPIQILQSLVSASYFDALKIPLVRGRTFELQDTPDAPRVALVNESMAKRVYGDADPLNRRINLSGDGTTWDPAQWRTIIGVVKDVKELGGADDTLPTIYEAGPQLAAGPALLIRASGDAMSIARQAAGFVHEMDAKRPVSEMRLLTTAAAERVAPSRLNATLFGSFAGVALVIAGIGIAGVLAFSVSERTREFGLRMALGADRSMILNGVLGEGLSLALGGLLVGVAGAIALSQQLKGLLFEVGTLDTLTFVLVGAALVLVALGASIVPARRATRVDPNVALRAQ